MFKKFDLNIIQAVFDKSNGHCWYCGQELTIQSRYEKLNALTYAIDHFIPKTLGGTDNLDNLAPTCWNCNGVKRNYSIEKFRNIRTRQLHGVPHFKDDQLTYLASHNITLPKVEPFVFYFEKEKLLL